MEKFFLFFFSFSFGDENRFKIRNNRYELGAFHLRNEIVEENK